MAMPVEQVRVPIGTVVNDLPVLPVLITSTLVLRRNPARKTATLQADKDNAEILHLRFENDGTATVDYGLFLDAGDAYEITESEWYGGDVYAVAGGQDTMYIHIRETE